MHDTNALGRHLAVVLHDVAPATWVRSQRLMALLQATARQHGVGLRVTLLVVPLWHGEPATVPFVRWLQHVAQAGHELALHGLTHLDEQPAPTRWRERLLRQVYTAGEGEFAALDCAEATRRLHLARGWADNLHLPVSGFVAPAWLLSAGARQALAASDFAYTCTWGEVIALPGWRPVTARPLVFSTRSAWRRALSLAWTGGLALLQRRAPLWRLELHPDDVEHAAIRRRVRRLLQQALRDGRVPLRLAQVEQRLAGDGTPHAAAAA